MGASHVKPSTQSEPTNLRELAHGPKHVSFADETSSQSQLSWSGFAHNVSGRLSLLSDRLSEMASLSWRSGRSSGSTRSSGRPWSRVSRKPWSQTTLDDPLLACKTAWPVSLAESLFLPEFPIKERSHEAAYKVVNTLGSGAFGKVYHVKHEESGDSFALKVLSKAHVVREGAIRQVKDEVSIQAACGHHPYVVACPDRWQTRKQLYVLQELVSGGELRDLWLRHGSLHEELVQLYVAELAVALDFLHNAGVIFRDLKLENVLLDDQLHVRLIDFGLAKWLRHGTRTQTLCGTLQYMAPELLEMQPYSHSVDWWSLGVVAFCLLSGNYPVLPERDHLEMRCALLAAEFRLPCHVSAPARALVARLLTLEPRHRLNSLLKLSREAWFMGFPLDAVRAREVSARLIYDKYYPAGSPTSESAAQSEDFIDFDATTVDESLGSAELVDEFPQLPAGSPRRAAFAASTPCRATAAALPLSPGSADDSVVASSGVLSPHRPFAAARPAPAPPPAQAPPLRAAPDTFEETSSGDVLELRLPDAPWEGAECGCWPAAVSESGAELGSSDGRSSDGGGAPLPGCSHWPVGGPPRPPVEDSLKRPGSAGVGRDEFERLWKRPRPAAADSWEEGGSGSGWAEPSSEAV